MFFGFGRSKRVIGIGLDGMPFSLAQRLIEQGVMPNLGRLAEGRARAIQGVLPTESNVGWSAFQTGGNPGEFGVFGFMELQGDLAMRITNANDVACPTLWNRLDEAGKTWAALGVPQTWPAPETDNYLVSGFLAPELDKRAVSRTDMLEDLRRLDYRIDVDEALAVGEPERFQRDLLTACRRRCRAARELLKQRKYNLFFVHFMETGHLHRYLWDAVQDGDHPDAEFCREVYSTMDQFVGQVLGHAEEKGYEVLACSDRGFADLEWGVQLNRWLREQGYLNYENAPARAFQAVLPGSQALSLAPGRIHILREDRWRHGAVSDEAYEQVRTSLVDHLRALTHPGTDQVVCKQVLRREEAFSGPEAQDGPDIVVEPSPGFDLQARLGAGHIFDTGARTGMHIRDDAMLLCTEELAEPLDGATDIALVGRRLGEHLT